MERHNMKTLTHKDKVTVVVGEWFDKTYGNTYKDATVTINGKDYFIPYQYGYDGASEWSIKEYLNQLGYRIRNGKRASDYVTAYTQKKLKRELNK